MARKLIPLMLLWSAVLLLQVGCSDQEPPPAKSATQPASRVFVPESVQGQWQAVRIEVLDKSNTLRRSYTINLGSAVLLDGTSLKLRADHFLPAFVIKDKTLTSVSNELKNPAVQITLFDNNQQIYQGWLYQNYPGTHTFQHPRFGFTLVDAIRAE